MSEIKWPSDTSQNLTSRFLLFKNFNENFMGIFVSTLHSKNLVLVQIVPFVYNLAVK